MADEGASPRELLLESCRRNNVSLLTDLLSTFPSPSAISNFLNTAQDGLGCGALHIAAQYGSYEVLDTLLDQEGVEIDLTEKREGDTCLHKAIRWVNGLGREEWADGGRVVEILLDAGCDPRIRNKAKLKPFDLVDPRNTELRSMLRKAEFTIVAGDDVVQDDSDDGGPASDSN
ncbi:Ankyrin repeat-containing protein [Sphaceloma murrayae]|uniref:Ankyrin repeat-containing protein n=1 Tax=Sphaceloma murrayae TaxID=2082308 RepID=A0A2K1QYG0_9PEZI|nr:Ankyrin repeat-containing protein [Sphaceloma murrayae]